MNAISTLSLHATAIALDGRGVLLTGPSGCGKSDLALRMVHLHGAKMVADDLVRISRDDSRLFASAPSSAPPRIDVRGIGVIEVSQWQSKAPIALIANLAGIAKKTYGGPCIDVSEEMLDLRLPRIKLDAWEISAAIKLILALERWGH